MALTIATSLDRNWQTDYGSSDRDFVRTKSLAIDVTTLGSTPLPPTLQVEVLWMARPSPAKRP